MKAPLIAIVDDDESVCVGMTSLVRSLGYDVRAYGSAEDFLGSEARGDTPCLISDVQMPGSMNGIDLAEWIARELPRVKVLLTSGKVAHDEVGDWPLLAKPYRLGALEGQLRAFLDPG